MKLFTAEDFESVVGFTHAPECAQKANAKLDEWLKAAPVVYGPTDESAYHNCEYENCAYAHSHSARLVDIRPIEKGERG